jgi:hypothetical protein
MLHDVPAGGAPHAGVRADVLERGIQSANRCGWPVTRGCTAIAMTRGTRSFLIAPHPASGGG